jgi:hypothetical protein
MRGLVEGSDLRSLTMGFLPASTLARSHRGRHLVWMELEEAGNCSIRYLRNDLVSELAQPRPKGLFLSTLYSRPKGRGFYRENGTKGEDRGGIQQRSELAKPMVDELEADQGVDSGGDVVEHDAPAFGQEFDLADGRRLSDVEKAKEDECDERVFPASGRGDEGDPLADDFVGDHDLGVFAAAFAGDDGRGGDADQCGGDCSQISAAAIEPAVPGPGFQNPVPKKVAMVHAQRVFFIEPLPLRLKPLCA